MSFTAQSVIDSVRGDIQQLTTNNTQILDYCNRISLQMMRASNWVFLESPPYRFITQYGQTDYWIGTSGSAPTSVVDTGLNLATIEKLKEDSVFDRSSFRPLSRTEEPPLTSILAYSDASSRVGIPRLWRNAPDEPYILNIYPGPDLNNTYRPVPNPPLLTTTAGGSLPARTYYIQTTLTDSKGGESTASGESVIYIPANSLVKVSPPDVDTGAASPGNIWGTTSTGVSYNKFNVYASTTSGAEKLQSTSGGVSLANWTEPTSGLTTSGVAVPSASTLEPLGGYVIEFRYVVPRTTISSAGQATLFPDEYKDIMAAGVSWLASIYLKRPEEALRWERLYREGLTDMVRDKNQFPKGDTFVAPDSATLASSIGSLDPFDQFFRNQR